MGRACSACAAASAATLAVAGCGGSPPADTGGPRPPRRRARRRGGADRRPPRRRDRAARRRPAPRARAGRSARRAPGRARSRRTARASAPATRAPTPTLVPAAETLPADHRDHAVPGQRRARRRTAWRRSRSTRSSTAGATAYAQDLVAGSYFSHTGRDGSGVRDRIERTGYLAGDGDWLIGENLAWGTGALATPGSIMQAWMNSPGHRENILNPEYREIGIGIVTGNPASRRRRGRDLRDVVRRDRGRRRRGRARRRRARPPRRARRPPRRRPRPRPSRRASRQGPQARTARGEGPPDARGALRRGPRERPRQGEAADAQGPRSQGPHRHLGSGLGAAMDAAAENLRQSAQVI